MSAVLSFLAPPPGFAPHTDFALTPVEGAEGLFAMQALDRPELRVFLVDPGTVVTGYAPVIGDEQAADLDLASADDALLLVVAHPGPDGVSVNLMAPVVVNRATGRAAQVILEEQGYALRTPLAS